MHQILLAVFDFLWKAKNDLPGVHLSKLQADISRYSMSYDPYTHNCTGLWDCHDKLYKRRRWTKFILHGALSDQYVLSWSRTSASFKADIGFSAKQYILHETLFLLKTINLILKPLLFEWLIS